MTRKTCPSSASSAVSACGRPTDGERSPKPSVVKGDEAEVEVLRLLVLPRLDEERRVAELAHRQVGEREQQTDEHVAAERAEHRLVRHALVVEDAARA